MSSRLRTFIAINLSKEFIEYISSLQFQLQQLLPHIKWVKPDNCHITLKFLGDVPTHSIPSLIDPLHTSLDTMDSFSLQTSDVGAFPSLQTPQILWLGLNDQNKKLGLLFDTVENTLVKLGFNKESRRFAAHITLGRARSTPPPLLSSIETKPIPILVDQITLYQSVLSSQRPQYVPLHTWSLK